MSQGIESYTLEDLAQNLRKQTKLSAEEIREQVQNKEEEYRPLLSKKSALLLVAKENSLTLKDLINYTPGPPELDAVNLVEDMNDVDILVTVDYIYDANEFDSGRVRNIKVSDETASTRVTLWNDDVEVADNLEPGEEIEIQAGYTKYSDYSDQVEIHIGDSSKIILVEDGTQLL